MDRPYFFDASADRKREQRRLDAQAPLLEPGTRRFLTASGIGPGMRVLDLGSGAGHVALLLSSLVGPNGSVLGVERDPMAVADARERVAAEGAANVAFAEGDVQTLDGVEGGFDAVVGRLILLYVPDPVAALRCAVTRVRPGGILAVQEPDFTYDWVSPPTPLWERVRGWCLETADRAGVDTRMGTRLYRCFLDAGLPDPQLWLEAVLMGGSEPPAWAWASVATSILPLMERFGVATTAEVGPETLAERLSAEVVAAKGFMVGPMMYGAAARLGEHPA